MILAMENAGKLIEDEELREQIKGAGIGTSATRAEIIKKLERIKPALYTQVKKIVEQHKHLGGITANLGGQRALIGRQKRTKFSYGTPEFYITQCDCEFL